MKPETLNKIEQIFDANKEVFNTFGRKFRLEFYPDDNYRSVTLYEYHKYDDTVAEEEVDMQLGLDEAKKFLDDMFSM